MRLYIHVKKKSQWPDAIETLKRRGWRNLDSSTNDKNRRIEFADVDSADHADACLRRHGIETQFNPVMEA